MTKSFMLAHRNEEVHHFLHLEVSTVDTAYDCLVLRNDYSDVHQREVYRKIMLKLWQRVVRTAAVQNIKVLIHRRQVSICTACHALTFSLTRFCTNSFVK